MPARLYLDNAATSHAKPPQVFEAMRAYAADLGVSAGRGAYREAIEAGDIVEDCRRRLARLIGAESPERVVFTFNCTGALNLAIKGLLHEHDHVVATTMEHNSVLRPLNALRQSRRIEVTYVPADGARGRVDVAAVFAAVRPATRLICVTHASNVTGTLQPVSEIGRAARRRGIFFLTDAAQTVGHVPINVRDMAIDLLAMPGHKGLMGPLGTGALYLRPGVESCLCPLVEGGTGTASELPVQPDRLPDKYEAGTPNAIGLAGLGAALRWIEEKTVAELLAHEQVLTKRFLDGTADLSGLTLHGPRDPDGRLAVFSVSLSGLTPADVSALLEGEFGLLTRSGMHCAPMAHETIGTYQHGGSTRISFGAFNTAADVDRCIEALKALARTGTPA